MIRQTPTAENMPLAQYIDRFRKQRLLVVGDAIVDHYIRGSVTRTSPEAPVPILAVEDEEWLAGGAANVARNITALGARAEFVGVVGEDGPAARLAQILAEDSLLGAHLLRERGRPTTLKTRAVAQGQQMLRLDYEVTRCISDATREKALGKIRAMLPKCGGVILSDYGKGFLTPELARQIIDAASAAGRPVFVDPKGSDYARYRGATVLTPNQKEASEASHIAIADNDSAARAARVLHRTVKGDTVVITRGAHGISVFPRRGRPTHIPARAQEVFDVTGAGDTVICVMALGLCSGAGIAEAAALSNLAGGIVVGIPGVARVPADRLRAAAELEDSAPLRAKGA